MRRFPILYRNQFTHTVTADLMASRSGVKKVRNGMVGHSLKNNRQIGENVIESFFFLSPVGVLFFSLHSANQKSLSAFRGALEPFLNIDVRFLRACSQSSEQNSQEGQVDELQVGIELALAVFP
jgi:hypothetical protein